MYVAKDSLMMFKKSCKSRVIRPRVASDDEDDSEAQKVYPQKPPDTQTQTGDIPPPIGIETNEDIKPPSSEQVDTSTNLPSVKLSFYNDDDNKDSESFEVKKTNRSLRLAKRLKRERRLKELRENQVPILSTPNDPQTDAKSGELEVVFQKFDLHLKTDGLESDDDMDISDHDTDDLESINNYGQQEPQKSDRLSNIKILRISSVLERKSIPDSNQIYEMKKIRRSARHIDDYISLFSDEEQNCSAASAVENINDSDSEDDDRIEFSSLKDVKSKEHNQAKLDILISQDVEKACSDEDTDDSDKDRRRWENDKILQGLQSKSIADVYQNLPAKSQISFKRPSGRKSVITIDDSKNYVRTRIASMKESVSKYNDKISHTNLSIKKAEKKISKLRRHNDNLQILQQIYEEMFCCAQEIDIVTIVAREEKLLKEAPENQRELILKLKLLLGERTSEMKDISQERLFPPTSDTKN